MTSRADEDGEFDDDSEGSASEGFDPEGAPIELEIGDVLDLHSFAPREVGDVVRAYLDEAHARGLRNLRIVHGKGIGVQREIVQKILARDPRVRSFGTAPLGAGGWGATWVELG